MKINSWKKFNEKVDTDFIKSEVDNYMFSITDDYQIDSSDDKILHHQRKNELQIIYYKIKIERKDIEYFIHKLVKIDKILKRDLNLFINGIELDSDDVNVWIGFDTDIIKTLNYYYDSDILITIKISGDV